MLIKSVTLKNFRIIENETFNFNKGITVFSGNNGEGKSTVLYAINMLLFETYIGNYSDYIKWDHDEFEISISFAHKGINWYKSFEYSKKSGGKTILRNEDTQEYFENSAASQKMKDIINIETAIASIVSNQDDSNLINTTPAKRREYLKSMYNLEFTKELETIENDKSLLENGISKLETEIQIKQSTEFSHKRVCDIPYSEEEIKTIEAKIELLNQKLSNAQLIEDKRNDIAHQISDCERTQVNLDSELKNNHLKIDEYVEKRNEFVKKLTSLSVDKEKESIESQYKESLIELKQSLATEEKNKKDYESDLNSLVEPEMTDINKEVLNLFVKLNQLNHDKLDSEKKLSVFREGKCPTCGHTVSEKELQHEEEIYNSLILEYKETQNKYDAAKKKEDEENSQIEAFKSKNRELQQKIEKSSGNIERLSENIKYKENELKLKLEQVEQNIKSQKELLEKDIEMNYTLSIELENKIREIESKYIDLNQKRSDLIEALERLVITDSSELRREKELESAKVKEYNDCIVEARLTEEYNKEQDKKKDENDKIIEELTRSLNNNRESLTIVEAAKKIISKEFPSFVIRRITNTLENIMNEFLVKVYPKYHLRIKETKTSLTIVYGENDLDVKLASGFEKSIFSLAWMFALGKIQKYGLLIIDEGDGAASLDKALQFYNVLGKSIEYFPQMFIISHKEEVKDLLRNDYNAEVYRMENGKSIIES